MKNIEKYNLHYINIKNCDIEKVRSEVYSKGYYVVDNLIRNDDFVSMRSHWYKFFNYQLKNKPALKPVKGNFHLGEKNFSTYTKDDQWEIFRTFEFYWNKSNVSEVELTKNIAIDLHKLKNILMKQDVNWGLNYTSVADEGTYLSLSHYPPESGFMAFHKDNVDYGKVFQFMVNLTNKNIDYNEGGLHLKINNEKVDVDIKMKPGSVLFFDGANSHGVIPVRSKSDIGRIAFFSIPCSFVTRSDVPEFIRFIEKIYFGLKRRINKLKGKIKSY